MSLALSKMRQYGSKLFDVCIRQLTWLQFVQPSTVDSTFINKGFL